MLTRCWLSGNCLAEPRWSGNLLCRVLVVGRVQELRESRGGRPGLPVLMSLTVSVDVKHDDDEVMLNVLRCQLTY